MLCNKCNAEIPDVAKFCPKCGNKTETQPQPKVEPQPVSTPAPEPPRMEKPAAEQQPRMTKEEAQVYQETVSNKSQGANTLRICNKCNAEIPDVAKFCPKCGNKTETQPQPKVEPQPVSTPVPEPPRMEKPAAEQQPRMTRKDSNFYKEPPAVKPSGSNTTIIVGILIAVIVLAVAAAGGFFVYKKFVALTPDKVQAKINAELKEKGLNIDAEIDKDWQANLSGTAKNKDEKETALGIVKAHKEVKDIKDNVTVSLSAAEVIEQINSALKRDGINDITAQPGEGDSIVLRGSAKDANDKNNAMRIAKDAYKDGTVKDEIQIAAESPEPPRMADVPQSPKRQPALPPKQAPITKMPPERPRADERFRDEAPRQFDDDGGMGQFRLQREVNLSLRRAGIRGIRAHVNDNMAIVLNGYAYSYEDKDRALRIAESFREARRVIDRISVER